MAVRADDVDLIRDRTLVESCQAGDERAFADLYERYYRRLLRFCTRRVGDVHEAEEIAQETFVRAFSAMPRFAGERRFYPWLTVIAGRLCIDSHRRVARTEPAAEIDLGSVEGGQQRVIDDVDRGLLATALDRLGPRHREVLELRETEGWSYQQIAEHYDVTMGTVEALLFRARKALRREFLAVAGDNGGRFGALPVLAVAYRATTALRLRLHGWAQHATPLAAAAGVASIAVMSGVVLAAPSTNHHHVSIPAPQLAASHPAQANGIVTTLPGSTPSATASTPVKPPKQRASAAANAVEPFSSGSAADGHSLTAADPTHVNIAGFTVATDATDPTQIVQVAP